ncbi:MAG: urease accessory protein UreD [Rhodoferax sp.]
MLDYQLRGTRTVARHRHEGPLRVLKSLYPEGDAVCHTVLVHAPGGLVGGDTLQLQVSVHGGAHGLITTPGATRFYRSAGEAARQHTQLRLDADARLEWLPLETLCYDGCLAENRLTLDLQPGAECMGWDLTALGLPQADQPFRRGSVLQHLEVPGVWLERARVAADDHRLLDGATGLAGHRCMGTLFWVAGSDASRARCDAALDAARSVIQAHCLARTAGATRPNARVMVVRVLAQGVEPALDLLQRIRVAWRAALWALPPTAPRIWAM